MRNIRISAQADNREADKAGPLDRGARKDVDRLWQRGMVLTEGGLLQGRRQQTAARGGPAGRCTRDKGRRYEGGYRHRAGRQGRSMNGTGCAFSKVSRARAARVAHPRGSRAVERVPCTDAARPNPSQDDPCLPSPGSGASGMSTSDARSPQAASASPESPQPRAATERVRAVRRPRPDAAPLQDRLRRTVQPAPARYPTCRR